MPTPFAVVPGGASPERALVATDSFELSAQLADLPRTLIVRPWPDTVIETVGYDPRSVYAEMFWLSVIGPTALWLVRRLVAGLEHFPDGYELDLGETARALGLGYTAGKAGPFLKKALTEVGLTDKRDQWPSVLSGGQKQRVALARALVSRPRVLAFDEPLGALDALTRISMQRLLERVWRDQGFTAILVTHDVAEAVALADRVLVIEEGRIAHDVVVNTARPRERGSAELAGLEGSILSHLLSADDRT
jgi:hypothetical protein